MFLADVGAHDRRGMAGAFAQAADAGLDQEFHRSTLVAAFNLGTLTTLARRGKPNEQNRSLASADHNV
jgi:hypothetical protein